ncbi:hypothetical protein NQ176_g1782 [Zarea fungicola]|uniref:Uncharacterized protein n=1 Tax=Zarea fungicola TaxID=93591 RepID=A0ACC1NSE6_9HYPO|nr:hypothetical protein NQ176_g1782 [Lecanicillium fungicola]
MSVQTTFQLTLPVNSSRVGRPRLDPYSRLLSRFYEPHLLLFSLGQTQDGHTPYPISASEHQEQRREFMRNLAVICDYKKGRSSFTAFAVNFDGQHNVYWLGSRQAQRCARMLNDSLEALLEYATALGQRQDSLQLDFLRMCVEHAKERIKAYIIDLEKAVFICIQELSSLKTKDNDAMVAWLNKLLERHTGDPVSHFAVCMDMYRASRSEMMKRLLEKEKLQMQQRAREGVPPGKSGCFAGARHSIGRLAARVGKPYALLLRRAIINTRRQPELILARTMQVVGLAGVFTLFFAPFGHDYFSVQNRMGYVQQVGAFYFVGMLQNVAVYPAERDVFYREDDDGVYSVDAFLLSYTILEVPFEILSCLVYGIFSTFAVRNPYTPSLFFAAFFACFGVVSCGESLGIMFNTLFEHTGFAVNIMGVFLSVANGMAGVLSINMPEAFKAVNYLSPIRYAARAIAPYAMRGVNFHCTSAQTLPDGSCPITSGEQVLELYNFDVDPNVNAYCLLACVVIYRLIAWALLRLKRARWKDKKRVEI